MKSFKRLNFNIKNLIVENNLFSIKRIVNINKFSKFGYLTKNHTSNKNINKLITHRRFSSLKSDETNSKVDNKEAIEDKDRDENKILNNNEINKANNELKEENILNTNQSNISKYRAFLTEKYTEEEFNDFKLKISSNNESSITLYEINTDNYKKLKLSKKVSLYFNIGMSVVLTILSETVIKNSVQYAKLKGVIFGLDYMLFIFGISILNGLRNVVIKTEYFPEKNVVSMTKLSVFSRTYTKEFNVSDLERMVPSGMSPLLTLKCKKTGTLFSMNGLGTYYDHKLFNYLFDPLKIEQSFIKNSKSKSNSQVKIEDEKEKKKKSKMLWD